MPRLHGFEFHDLSWFPAVLRESTVETLSRAIETSRLLAGPAEALADLLEQTGGKTVLDLCSGAGAPAALFAGELRRRGVEGVRFLVSDLYPNPGAFEALARRHPGSIEGCEAPVDATDVPRDIDHEVRTIVNAFHHFSPGVARSILEAAVRDRKAILVVEACPRSLGRFLAFLPHLVRAALRNPFRAPRRRLAKFALTYLLPVQPLTGLFDGFVSVGRMHEPFELDRMTDAIGGGYVWRHGVAPYAGWGRATWLAGYPAGPASGEG